MKYILFGLIALVTIFSYLSYHFYGQYKQVASRNDLLVSSLQECQKQKQQANDVSKVNSEGLGTALSENEKLTKDFESLKDQLKKKRCYINANPTQGDRQKDISSVSPDNYVSDVNKLLREGYHSATNNLSEPPKSSPK